ncbi:MAG: sigma-E processing peptidase SpoIIGA [Lachnospiraceae bacterium]|nr:sigma-E processing peptidase SpoIIGA [Lachnospiraceae bacterium]
MLFIYDFYLDVYFVETFVETYLLLRITASILRRSATRIRCALCAAVAALTAVGGVLLLPILHMTGTILVSVAADTLLIMFGCKIKEGKRLIQGVGLYYAVMAVSHLVFAQIRLFTGTTGVRAFVITALLSYAILRVCLRLYERQKKAEDRIWDVTLYQDGKCKRIKGLYDTGNLLWDPVLKKEVSVMGTEPLIELLPEKTLEALKDMMGVKTILFSEELEELVPHYISYCCVGTKAGILPVIVLEKLCLKQGDIQKVISHPAVAVDREFSSSPRNYQMILNPNLVQRFEHD